MKIEVRPSLLLIMLISDSVVNSKTCEEHFKSGLNRDFFTLQRHF